MDLPDFLKPTSRLAPPGTDPLAMPTHRARGPNKLLLGLLIVLMIGFVCAGAWGVTGWFRKDVPTATAVIEPTLVNPAMEIVGPSVTPSATPSATLITAGGLLTAFASPQSPTPTACPAANLLTQQACDNADMTATFAAAAPGDIINVSGVDPNQAVVIVLASPTWTPWVITATQTFTPRVEYVEVTRIITATAGPTQTPWFYITQPPIVTVAVTRLVTVVVTATPTETPWPTDTAPPSETPTETATATETPTP